MADQRIIEFGDRLLDGVKTRLGAAWTGLTPDEQLLVTRVCGDAAVVYADVQAGRQDAELKHVRAQLAGLATIGAADLRQTVRDVFWKLATDAVGLMVAAAL